MAETNRNSFIFYRDWYDAIMEMDDSIRLEIYDAIMNHSFTETRNDLSPLANTAMKFIRPQIERDISKWMDVRKKRAESGKKGGLSKSKQNVANEANAIFAKQNKQDEANEAVNVNVNVNVDNIDVINKKEDTIVSEKKDELFENCWLAYGRKGSKKKSLDYWKKLTDEEKGKVLPHIKVYTATREKQFQKDFERYLRDKVFSEVVIRGNQTIYDPMRFTDDEYRPSTDGVFQFWDEENKRLVFNGDISKLDDGYTEDSRPDNATAVWGMYEWRWNRQMKEWIKQ